MAENPKFYNEGGLSGGVIKLGVVVLAFVFFFPQIMGLVFANPIILVFGIIILFMMMGGGRK